MYTVTGQLAIKTIHGRNGPFNVGYLVTPIGEFITKNAELDQFNEGRYPGEFTIADTFLKVYEYGARMIIEKRARLDGMKLFNVDPLTQDEAGGLSPQVVDPIDEEAPGPQLPSISSPSTLHPQPAQSDASDPLVDTTPFGDAPVSLTLVETPPGDEPEDQKLFGANWPLGDVVKIDSTIDRAVQREQRTRLDLLGYGFNFKTQDWHLKQAA
jgi:hypothetical protein